MKDLDRIRILNLERFVIHDATKSLLLLMNVGSAHYKITYNPLRTFTGI